MNKFTILFLTLCYGLNSCAQSTGEEAYINDPDGYTNVRDGQSGSDNILTTIKTGELFQFLPSDKSNWWQVTKTDGTTGYVHNSRIVSVTTQTKEISKLIQAIRTTNPNDVEFSQGSNEILFIYAEQYPKSFINAFSNASEQSMIEIVKELEAPIHDGIDLKLVYQRIKGTGISTNSTSRILEAIKVAGNKMKLDVTK